MGLKSKKPYYKVWIEIEKLTPDGDVDNKYIAPLPDCVGVAKTEKEAMSIQYEVARVFGIDPDRSDCRPKKNVKTVLAGLRDFVNKAKSTKLNYDINQFDKA